MKKIVLILLCFSLPYYMVAQENATAPKKVKEVGLVFTGLNSNFGFTFKTGNENALWRFTALNLTGNRKPILNKVSLRYGMDLGFNFSYSNETFKNSNNGTTIYETEDKRIIYTPEIKFLLGVSYLLNDKIIVGAEILPEISYKIGSSTQERKLPNPDKTEKDISGFGYGFSNNSVRFSIAYRF